jgi:3-oxoadipate enol-lactonase
VVLLPHDDVGTGLAVVLLHAGIADRTMWAEHLRPVAAAGYRVVAMDVPGFP